MGSEAARCGRIHLIELADDANGAGQRAAIGFRESIGQPRRDSLHLGLRGCAARPGRESAEHREPAVSPAACAVRSTERDPYMDRTIQLKPLEPLRRNPGNDVFASIDLE